MARKPEVIDVDAGDEKKLIQRRLDSETGFTVAYKFGKTSAREVVFTRESGALSALLMSRDATESYYGSVWIITTDDGHIVGMFNHSDVLGLWITGGTQTVTP